MYNLSSLYNNIKHVDKSSDNKDKKNNTDYKDYVKSEEKPKSNEK